MNAEVKRTLRNGKRIIPRGLVGKIYMDMKTKYVQKVIPRVSTERYRKMSPEELRKEAFSQFNKHCKGKVATNLHTGIPVKLVSGRKTAFGEAIYSKKVAVIPKLQSLIENACYSNWGLEKPKIHKRL